MLGKALWNNTSAMILAHKHVIRKRCFLECWNAAYYADVTPQYLMWTQLSTPHIAHKTRLGLNFSHTTLAQLSWHATSLTWSDHYDDMKPKPIMIIFNLWTRTFCETSPCGYKRPGATKSPTYLMVSEEDHSAKCIIMVSFASGWKFVRWSFM